MTSVKPYIPPPDERPIPLLLGRLFKRFEAGYTGSEWEGLRQSHFRVMSMVSPDVSITELAERVQMTKQGCGQFVQFLSDKGYLSVTRDPADRRARLVSRTAAGDQMVRAVLRHSLVIEDDWREQVGRRRYATFRAVLREIAQLDD